MFDSILNKLDFTGPNLGWQAFMLCCVLYLIILACTFASIFSQGVQLRTKLIWVLIVTCLPFIGIVLYAMVCAYANLRTHPILGHFLTARKTKRKA